MRAAIWCRASPSIGGGHVMRCLTLAGELAAVGLEVEFHADPVTLRTVPRLGEAGYALRPRSEPPAASELDGVGLVLFDDYGVEAEVERRAGGPGRVVAVVDDLVDRPHDCDVLLDATVGRVAADYAGLVPPRTEVLAGAAYTLLRPEFAAARADALERRERLERPVRVLVTLGLTDVGGVTGRVVEALVAEPWIQVLDVLTGSGAPSLAGLEALAATDPRVELTVDARDVARRMGLADLAVGAGGTTTWERCCLGLPTVVLTLADNQRDIARRIVAAGAGLPAQVGQVAERARELAEDPARLAAMARAAAAVCDGLGARRVAAVLAATTRGAAAAGGRR